MNVCREGMEIFLLAANLESREEPGNSCQLRKIKIRKLILMEILLPVSPLNGDMQMMLSNAK